jgi:hypothetical protein
VVGTMMGRWTNAARKLWRLPPAERRLLLMAASLMVVIKLGLTVLPYRRLRKLVDGASFVARRRPLVLASAPELITRAVARASRTVPGATCLTQALAAKVMLERFGYPARVHVGIGRTEGAPVIAHAWVESDARIVLGGAELTRYTPLPALEA